MSIPGHHQPFPASRFPTGNARPGGNAKPTAGAGFQRSRPEPFPDGGGNAQTLQRRHFPGSRRFLSKERG
jgi:hypothetical protein